MKPTKLMSARSRISAALQQAATQKFGTTKIPEQKEEIPSKSKHKNGTAAALLQQSGQF
jgi:hypothetical protein